jgi:hypothetical protein
LDHCKNNDKFTGEVIQNEEGEYTIGISKMHKLWNEENKEVNNAIISKKKTLCVIMMILTIIYILLLHLAANFDELEK